MAILMWILAGLIVGAVAKWVVPGKDPGGAIATMGLGIAGAFVGGMIASVTGLGGISGPNVQSFFTALVGAVLLLLATRWLFGKAA
jgi:uncharacterized membrane protein YeaQ/YmgE (transglycosylase-associated protein family)